MKYFFAFLVGLISGAKCQNLVPNGGFENTFSCSQYLQNGGPPLLLCNPWYQAFSSPDFFTDSVPLLSCGGAVLPNTAFGNKYPRNGNAMGGFSTFDLHFTNYREIIGAPLLTTMIANHIYYVEIYVSPAPLCKIVSDDIGIHFEVDSLTEDTFLYFTILPQVENVQGNFINDTASWTKISGYYTATGAESYIYIGNFKDDTNTTIDSITGPSWDFSYYFLDDVSVIDCTATAINEFNIEHDVKIFPNPVSDKLTISAKDKYSIEEVFIESTEGKTIIHQQQKHKKQKVIIDVAMLPSGTYIVRVVLNNGHVVKKVVKF